MTIRRMATDKGIFITAEVDDAMLDPYEFRIYAMMLRAGDNGRTPEEIAAHCRISISKVNKSLSSLERQGFITIDKD